LSQAIIFNTVHAHAAGDDRSMVRAQRIPMVAAINDKLRSWLFCTSIVIGLVISGAILMLP
jgi:hypothetical protein